MCLLKSDYHLVRIETTPKIKNKKTLIHINVYQGAWPGQLGRAQLVKILRQGFSELIRKSTLLVKRVLDGLSGCSWF